MAGHAQRQQERSSKRLFHDFTLPSELKWGYRKHLRCDKSTHGNNPNSTPRSNTTNHFADNRKSPISGSGGEDQIEIVREKLMTDFRMATDRLKLTILDGKRKNHNDNNWDDEKKTPEEDSNSLRPWNLRTRRAACKGPIDAGGVMGNNKLSPLRRVDCRLRSETLVDRAESKEGNNGPRGNFLRF